MLEIGSGERMFEIRFIDNFCTHAEREIKDYSGYHIIKLYALSTLSRNVCEQPVLFEYEAVDDVPHGYVKQFFLDGSIQAETYFHKGVNLFISPSLLTSEDKMIIGLSGRLPEHLRDKREKTRRIYSCFR